MEASLHRSFIKKFKKLRPEIRRKFQDRKRIFLINPRHPLLENHPLSGDHLGQWSINVTGDYRALYEFKSSDTIIFIDIDTHSNLYKK